MHGVKGMFTHSCVAFLKLNSRQV